MTIADTSRKAGPFVGDGQTVSFPFNFRIFSEDQLIVLKSSSASEDVRLSRGIDYRVDLNVNQDVDAGGNVILTSPLAQGANLAILSNVPYSQETIFTNKGGFYPAQLNEALDKSTALVQQLHEKLDRALTVPATQTKTPIELIDELFTSEARSREQAELASASAVAALASQTAARSSELAAKASEKNAKASEKAASFSEQRVIAIGAHAAQLAEAALASQQAAKASESAAQISETNASNSQAQALLYMQKAKAWATNVGVVENGLESSKTYAERAGSSQASVQANAERAAASESNARASAESAQTAAIAASASESNSRSYSNTAQTSAQSAQSTLSMVQALKNSVETSKTEVDTIVAQLNNPTAEVSIVGENESPSVSVARNASEVHWTFVIPRGHTGATGLKGEKGDKGDRGEKGDKGDKGDPFHYSDFTATQLEALRGPRGPQGPQGEKGDPLRWDDLSEEQKSQLKVTLPDDLVHDAELTAALMPYAKTVDISNAYLTKSSAASTYATKSDLASATPTGMLYASKNLSDLANKATARTNLGLGAMAVKNALSYSELSSKPTFSELAANNRGTLSGYETAQALTGNQTFTINSPSTITIATRGSVTLTFTPADATQADVKVIALTATEETTLNINGAVWANKGRSPAWGAKGKHLVLVAHFIGGRVVLSVFDND